MLVAPFLLAVLQTGHHYYVSPTSIPKPGKSNYLRVPTLVRRPNGFKPKVPKGFKVEMFATGLKSPRWLFVTPNADVIVTESYQGRLIRLRDTDHTGVADLQTVFASGLNLPTGMAIRNGYFYVANTDSVVRFKYRDGQSSLRNAETVVKGIPSRGYRQHWTRNLLFDPSGQHFYLTIGSETNKSAEPLPRGAIWRYNTDGSGKTLVASGIRNPVGLALNPSSGALWATCVERDYEGDDVVPDFFTQIKNGQWYGWPYYYVGSHVDPAFRSKPRPKRKADVPDVLFNAHSTPLQFIFYTGSMFPASYRGDALVAMRGSTNRLYKSGYKVVRVHFQNGRPTKGYDDFMWGLVPDPKKREVYGRPVGMGQLPDGSVLVADEGGHCIWRISYSG